MIHSLGRSITRVFCLLLLVLCASPMASAAEAKTNVLFLICDDLNCDLGCYGHPQVKSPNIDQLAKQGVRFEHAYCQFPLCGPSRASFMTGMYPDQTLVHRNAIYIREHVPNVQTMSQMFRNNGYFATRVGKIYHYNVPKHIGTGGHDDPYSWNQTFNPRGRDVDDEDKIFSLTPGSFGGTLSWLAADGTDEEQTDGIAADIAVEQLKQFARKKQPFFLAVGLYRPHTPYVAPKNYFEMYPTDQIKVPQIPEGYLETIPKPARQSVTRKKNQIKLPDNLSRQAIQAYYASITFADAQLGKILETLKQTGLDDNTIIVFTSDHGYHMGEHGHWQKTTLFENAARVPMIIAGPGVTAKGQTALSPAEMVDFYPTLAELCALKAPASTSGVSQVPTLKDAATASRESALTQYANGYSIRTPRYRYTEWGDKGEQGVELYDHETDTVEMKNLGNDPATAQLRKRLAHHLHKRIEQANQKPKGVKQVKFENRRRVPR
ncbi:sulfatase [Gimesia fumaroli]|uniref:Choline-sulfatase n=1 Tax=Gimesia fumaroli TaxID=2527976 RepID=A0A518IJQ8_9PLAN|nr:sulfatase [Gimesia fumaroli]QDV53329.1 Choline-sulfatase [Gimesia fumaroli]